MIEWGQKSIPKKISRASNKTPKYSWTFYPKNIPYRFSEPQTRKIETFVMECLCLFIYLSGIRTFFTSGGNCHSTDRDTQEHILLNCGMLLYSWNYAARIHGNYHQSPYCFVDYPKNPYLNQATQKIHAKIFLPKKIPKSKI